MKAMLVSDSFSTIETLWKGQIPYRESLLLQEELKQKVKRSKQAFLLGFECPSCITLGLRGKETEDLRDSFQEYQNRGIEIVSIKRGGQATLHSPGQLIIYPIMDLMQWKIRPRNFLNILEKITIDALAKHGLLVKKDEATAGLFTNQGKIAFFGIHISSGVSQHGLAINVKNDLSLFDLIRSCGVSQRAHDSFAVQGLSLDLATLFKTWSLFAHKYL